MIAGVESIKKGFSQPVGSLTQMGRIRLGKRTDDRFPLIKDFVPLAGLEDIVFGGWDVYSDNVFEAAANAKVLEPMLLHAIKPELEALKPMKAVFDKAYARNLDGTHVKEGANKMELAEMLMEDIRSFKETNGCDRLVMVWCGSTEIYIEESDVHRSVEAFEQGLVNNDPAIAPSMIYAYAAIKTGVPFANGAPNLTVDIPAIV
ncbi:inositol-3-phosphate synthase, partial [Rufibacter sp. H-1]|nr:inositol-3-phosphate synthase [Rufibacter sediminis]